MVENQHSERERCGNTVHSNYITDHRCKRERGHPGDCLFGAPSAVLQDTIQTLISERDDLEEQLEALGPDAARKVEAYDAARATVKREGNTRAEYVLRAEHAEEQYGTLWLAAEAVFRSGNDAPSGMGGRYVNARDMDALGAVLYPAKEHIPWGPDHPSYDEMGQ